MPSGPSLDQRLLLRRQGRDKDQGGKTGERREEKSSYACAVGPGAGDRMASPSRPAGPRVLSETPRCMARCAWQSDADANKCSISRCNNTFSWMPGARRHHCRQCGRVVCQDCSRGQVANKTFRPLQKILIDVVGGQPRDAMRVEPRACPLLCAIRSIFLSSNC